MIKKHITLTIFLVVATILCKSAGAEYSLLESIILYNLLSLAWEIQELKKRIPGGDK